MLGLVNNMIDYAKDNGSYQNNIGIRVSELNMVKTRISDIIFNYGLLNTASVNNNDLWLRLNKDIENFKDLEEKLDEIIALLQTDTNSAKYITRNMIQQLETYKEGHYEA